MTIRLLMAVAVALTAASSASGDELHRDPKSQSCKAVPTESRIWWDCPEPRLEDRLDPVPVPTSKTSFETEWIEIEINDCPRRTSPGRRLLPGTMAFRRHCFLWP